MSWIAPTMTVGRWMRWVAIVALGLALGPIGLAGAIVLACSMALIVGTTAVVGCSWSRSAWWFGVAYPWLWLAIGLGADLWVRNQPPRLIAPGVYTTLPEPDSYSRTIPVALLLGLPVVLLLLLVVVAVELRMWDRQPRADWVSLPEVLVLVPLGSWFAALLVFRNLIHSGVGN